MRSRLLILYIDKLALNCACVGGNSKAPLGVVSFAENAIMAIMGAMLIFSATTGEVKSAKIQEVELNTNTIVQLQDATVTRIHD